MRSALAEDPPRQFTAFAEARLIASGALAAVLPKVRAVLDAQPLIFADDNGDLIEPDWRLSDADILADLQPRVATLDEKRPGRPRLGVVAREVTLLPRHWEWLAGQPEGTSAALRKLVEQARRSGAGQELARRSLRAADRFMYRMAGDLPQFEEAYRALYAKDFTRMSELTDSWPADIRDHLARLTATLARDLEGIPPADSN